MPRSHALCVSAIMGLILSACAYVTAVPVEPGSHVSGIRIYDVKPILIVTRDAYRVEMVPNYNRAYALRFGAFLAKNDTTVAMTNGLVSTVDTNLDSTDALRLFEITAQRLLPQLGQGTSGSTQRGSIFGVYEFRFDDNGELIGLFELPLNRYPPELIMADRGDDPPPEVEQN